MMQTNILRGMRKKLMMVDRLSSGTYWLRIFIMLGQKRPTQASNTQKASSWTLPSNVMPAIEANTQKLSWYEGHTTWHTQQVSKSTLPAKIMPANEADTDKTQKD